MSNLVIMKNKQVLTTSLNVAENFVKNYRDVLAAIDYLKEGLRKITQTYFGKIPKK